MSRTENADGVGGGRERLVSEALVTLANTLFTDYDMIDPLDHLVS